MSSEQANGKPGRGLCTAKEGEEASVYNALVALTEPGQVVELRALNVNRAGAVYSGYYNDMAAMARDAKRLSGKATGVYFTPNPVHPDLLARACNRLKERPPATTTDGDVIRRCW